MSPILFPIASAFETHPAYWLHEIQMYEWEGSLLLKWIVIICTDRMGSNYIYDVLIAESSKAPLNLIVLGTISFNHILFTKYFRFQLHVPYYPLNYVSIWGSIWACWTFLWWKLKYLLFIWDCFVHKNVSLALCNVQKQENCFDLDKAWTIFFILF